MASINNWESKILSIGIILLTADDELCDGIDTDCDGSSTIRYPDRPSSCNSLDYDCDSAADADDPTWGQEDDWSNYGEYAYGTDLTDERDEGLTQAQRLAWREGPLAALKIFVPLVQNERQWERLIERFPALDDRGEWFEGCHFHRLCALMDPPRYVKDILPIAGRRHYGAWQRWRGAKDPSFAEWVVTLLNDEEDGLGIDAIFEKIASHLALGFFDL